ncbi:MAG TPA: protein kinase [Gemmatimonadaceae bacterium]|nr:protein kinase [Gemmatimonadaceae bacterium]
MAREFLQTLNDTLPDYTVERELGGGGMSRVFLAVDKKLERSVVIKVLPENVAGGISVDRFRREIHVAANLQHPHIVPVLSAGEIEGNPYFTMPYIAGETLSDRIARDGELPIDDAVRILRDLASALAYAHRNGVVHRDIKPANVLLTDEYALVTDFGVAKALSASALGDDSETLTSAGSTLGTPAYMSPEQAAAEPSIDHRTDIYSFGVVAYEVLTGTPPFAERNQQALMAAHATKTPEAISARRAILPAWLASLVMRCLEKRPADRPQTAAEIVRILQTPEGSGSTASVTAHAPAQGKRANLAMTVAGVTVVVILAGAAAFALSRRTNDASTADQAITSVAVLPLVNRSGSKEDEYFSDGMTDELANVLSKIPGLRVASRTSAYSFKGKQMSVGDIGHALNVQAVFEGSVRRAGGKLRVTGQLTSVRDGLSLWTDSYERDPNDIFAVQDEIARSIADKLKLRLTASASKPDAGAGTTNVEAYDEYLRGRYFWNARGAENLRHAIEYFDKAIALDTGFARAYAARAITYALLPEYSDASPVDALQKTRADGEKALARDPTLAEAQTGIALALVHSRRWDDAERAYQKAIALDPNYPTAHQWYGELLYNTSRLDSSVAETARARRLDPLAPILAAASSYALSLAQRYPDALTVVKQGIELAPNLGVLHSVAAQIYVGLKDASSARREMELAVKLDRELLLRQGQLAYVYAATGDTAQARAVLKRMQEGGAKESGHAVAFAIPYMWLGDRSRAMSLLEQAAKANDVGLLTAASPLDDPLYAPVRNDPRFLQIMERMGLSRFIRD